MADAERRFGPERLLGGSSIYLFGRVLSDISVRWDLPDDDKGIPRRGQNLFLQSQYNDAGLARIYAFSIEGSLYEFARPAIFLVHGAGSEPDYPPPADAAKKTVLKRLSRSPGGNARTGLSMQYSSFAADIRVWVYDKNDMTIRLDPDSGTFEQTLLERELSPGSGVIGGSFARSSGAAARSSGLMARSSGWSARRIGDDS